MFWSIDILAGIFSKLHKVFGPSIFNRGKIKTNSLKKKPYKNIEELLCLTSLTSQAWQPTKHAQNNKKNRLDFRNLLFPLI